MCACIILIIFFLSFLALCSCFGPLGFLMGVSVLVFGFKAVEKTSKKKIYAMKKADVVFVLSDKTYAIPIRFSHSEVVLLYVNFKSSDSRISFVETKHLLSNLSLTKIDSKNHTAHNIRQISSVAKDLYLNIYPQGQDLNIKLTELRRLEELARSSRLYRQQASLYFRASNQVKELFDANEKLSRECYAFIRDILIGQELMKYNVDDMPDILTARISLDNRSKEVSDQYHLLKSEMDEYMNLKNIV